MFERECGQKSWIRESVSACSASGASTRAGTWALFCGAPCTTARVGSGSDPEVNRLRSTLLSKTSEPHLNVYCAASASGHGSSVSWISVKASSEIVYRPSSFFSKVISNVVSSPKFMSARWLSRMVRMPSR